MKRIIISILAAGLIALLFPQCAKIVAPTGGPKDTLAPVMTASKPLPNATNFKGKELTFTFNEFITLDNAQQQLLVSPPLKRMPNVTLKGKKLVMSINDTLLDNTTYSIFLGNAIKDINEGNPYEGFEFAFSTGSVIDSMMLCGEVIDGHYNQPIGGVMVLLYSQMGDSLPYITRPDHVGRTDAYGHFRIANLKRQNYKIVALHDRNADYLYNQGIERFGFLSDINLLDYLYAPHDSTHEHLPALRLFVEERPQTTLMMSERPTPTTFKLCFSRSPQGQYSIAPFNFTPAVQPWYVSEPDNNGDTLQFWIIDTTLFNIDTLSITLDYAKTNERNIAQPTPDTVNLVSYELLSQKAKAASNDSKRKNKQNIAKTDEKPKNGTLTASISANGTAKPTEPLTINLPYPARLAHPEQITLFHINDSTNMPVTLVADSISPLRFNINQKWESDHKYKLTIPTGAFEPYAPTPIDTFTLAFSGANPEKFGEINLTTTGFSSPLLIELLTEQNKPVAQKWAASPNNTTYFGFIAPAKYIIRITEDINGNRQWDTGQYLKGIQPEQTHIYTQDGTELINVKANWENNLNFSKPEPSTDHDHDHDHDHEHH